MNMTFSRRQILMLTAAFAAAPGTGMAQASPELWAQYSLFSGEGEQFISAIGFILERGTPDMAAGVILAMRFGRAPEEIYSGLLTKITGDAEPKTWFDWVVWQERHPEIVPHESYVDIMRMVHLGLDESFDDFLQPQYLAREAAKIRVEEIMWGGVRKDGIPSLDNPSLIDAETADYLLDDDLVFGVSINGDARAYPLRIMGWHEMFNDVIGGVPVALAYCTLCGSGILFDTARDGEDPFVFGSSGFLYRSNKLMFDRQTHTLWNQFTGKPVVGPLVGSEIVLSQRPVVIDSWANWRAQNPTTKVLNLETGYLRNYNPGAVYKEYFASPDLMFPALVDQTTYHQKDYVFGIRTFGAAKAWPLDAFEGGRVINDDIAGTNLVLIGDASRRAVRAYERNELNFKGTEAGVMSGDGVVWTVQEEQLTAADGRVLPRVAGHIAYWFAWDGYMGDVAEVYQE